MLGCDVVLLTVNYNSRNALEMALKSYVHWHYKGTPLPLCVIDNGSKDDSVEWMVENHIPHIPMSYNMGHMKAVNHCLDLIGNLYDWVFLIDCDVRFDDDVLSKCDGSDLVYANLENLFLGCINFTETPPESYLRISMSMSGKWWIKRLQPARCLMKWAELKSRGLKDFQPRDYEEKFFDYHADPGSYFFSELKRIGISHSPFPEGTYHYQLSSFRGDGTYPDRQLEIRETIPRESIMYKNVELKDRFCHFSETFR